MFDDVHLQQRCASPDGDALYRLLFIRVHQLVYLALSLHRHSKHELHSGTGSETVRHLFVIAALLPCHNADVVTDYNLVHQPRVCLRLFQVCLSAGNPRRRTQRPELN